MKLKHVCGICGKPFDADHNDRICDSCKKKLTEKLMRGDTLPGVCPVCGAHFKERKNKFFCSKSCRITAYTLPGMKDIVLNRFSDTRPKSLINSKITKPRLPGSDVQVRHRRKKAKINARIDEICRKAREAGLSYGKYIAKHKTDV